MSKAFISDFAFFPPSFSRSNRRPGLPWIPL